MSSASKVAIVTGASRGIGAGITSAFRAAGYAVVAMARSIQPSDDPELATIEGDIAEAATAERVVGLALERFGRIDSLVNNGSPRLAGRRHRQRLRRRQPGPGVRRAHQNAPFRAPGLATAHPLRCRLLRSALIAQAAQTAGDSLRLAAHQPN
jgi:short chain dehydrogenase